MAKVHVVGSGASAVHFALSLLEKGHEVVVLDVGFQKPAQALPDRTFQELKGGLDDPSGYFLGDDFHGAMLPGLESDLYSIPPSKEYVFRQPDNRAELTRHGFRARRSFARGGLGEAWTAGCYPFADSDFESFPFAPGDIQHGYATVARRVGISGAVDDLSSFIPVHDHLQPPLPLDENSEQLLTAYGRKRRVLNDKLGFHMGRTRVATLSRPQDSRSECRLLGRCLWGCPVDALYTPSQTLRLCQGHDRFTYRPNIRVDHFRTDAAGRIDRVIVRSLDRSATEEVAVDTLVLAAGALSSSEILLRSVYKETGEVLVLRGLMDNRQVHVPFLNLAMLGRPTPAKAYQYHLVGIGLDGAGDEPYIHCQVTTLTTALMHPIIQKLPLDLAASARIAGALQSALCLANVNFRDTRRHDNYVTLEASRDGGEPRLSLHYVPDAGEPLRIAAALKRLRRGLAKLNCVVPPGMTGILPMGSSFHYAGTLPATADTRPWTTTPQGRSRDYPNLFVIDGSTFPYLPALNPTFTLMANAVRIADASF